MSHFAEVIGGVVQRVIVAEQDFINSGAVGAPSNWIQVSYNTRGGVHALGGVPLRKNYPGAGFLYDSALDAFIPPKPFASWVLNETTCLWEAPIPMPTACEYCMWDESTRSWVTDEAYRAAMGAANEVLDDSSTASQ